MQGVVSESAQKTSVKSLRSRLVGRFYLLFVVVVGGLSVATTILQIRYVAALNLPELPSKQLAINLTLIAAIGLLVALAVGLVFSLRLASPLADLIRVAEAMRSGHYEERVAPTEMVDLNSLGQTLNVLGEEVSSRIERMSRDQAQLRSILSAMVEGIIAFDKTGRILFSNQSASRLLQCDLRLCRGVVYTEISGIFHLRGLIDEARDSSSLVAREICLGPAAEPLVVATKALPFKYDSTDEGPGSGQGIVVVLHDVTNLRRLEGIRRDFVANVSHELKTPLTAIRGYVETLLAGAVHIPETNVRFLEKIDRNVDRLTALVQDILSLARIENHEDLPAAGHLRPVDWRSVIHSVVGNYEDAANVKKIDLQVHDPGMALLVSGEREAMIQILGNLVSNAVKYTPTAGKVTISGYQDINSGEVVVEVCDTGIGIPEKHLERIFERFYRVDVARSRELGGTGLGLSIVKHLVASLGGTITVESHPGEGSVFQIRMKSVVLNRS